MLSIHITKKVIIIMKRAEGKKRGQREIWGGDRYVYSIDCDVFTSIYRYTPTSKLIKLFTLSMYSSLHVSYTSIK